MLIIARHSSGAPRRGSGLALMGNNGMLIKNATILDGTGKPRYAADIRIEKDRIKHIGKLNTQRKELTIDATGKFVCPGFIDIINRSDIHMSIFNDGGMRSLIKQGVTTILGGSCGTSLAPIISANSIKSVQKWDDISKININWSSTREFLDEVVRHHPSLNFATLTGHATIRRGLMGDNFGALSPKDLKRAEYLLEKSLEDGAFGFSMGLAYSHERGITKQELDKFIRITKRKDAMLAVHLRDEGKNLLEAVSEVLDLAQKYKIRIHIYHFKAFGREAWGMFPRALESIEVAREKGVRITFDVYPYIITSSVLYLVLPEWVGVGGKKEALKRLCDKTTRERIRSELSEKERDFEEIVIANGNIDNIFIGKTLKEIARNQETNVIDALLNIIVASEDQIIGFLPFVNDKNAQMAMLSRAGIIASDGAGYKVSDNNGGATLVHPRNFGTFPKFLREYAEERKLLSWEEAIHKITLMPAEKIGFEKRGKIEKGWFADIAIFDPQKIQDLANFKNPFQYSHGIEYVIVNGGFALKRGKFQKERSGKVLRK